MRLIRTVDVNRRRFFILCEISQKSKIDGGDNANLT